MEWIKAKYDRLLLGVFGVIALLIGGLLVMKVLGFKKQFPPATVPIIRADFGKGEEEAKGLLTAAKTHLSETVAFKPPVHEGTPIGLFTSAPVIKNDKQEVIPILDPKAKKVREPIDNRWLYDHDLNMQDANIATADTDGDGYTNTEEFLANTDPKDKNSNPGLQTKIEYKEVVKDPMTIKFNTYLDDKDMTFRRTEPADKAFNTEHIKVGDTFPSEKAGVPRFKVTKILPPKEGKQHVAVLEDLLLKGTPIEVEIRHTFEMPSRRAKLVCKLGKEEEKVVSEAEEFYFAAEPDLKFTVKSITDEEVTLEFTPKGKTEKSSKTFKIPPPP